MTDLKGKRILLLYAKFFNYDIIVSSKLCQMGAIVDLYDARANLSVFEKAVVKVHKGHFHKKLKRFHGEIIEANKDKVYDFIFSNSYLPREIVISYKKKYPSAKFILYLDDSVRNTYDIENTFKYYDVVKTFDRLDAEKYNIQFQPLFFEDSYRNTTSDDVKYDLCFIGTIHSDRMRIISQIEEICVRQNLTFYNYSYLQSKFIYYFYWFTKREFRKKTIKYFHFNQLPSSEVASIISSSRAVLDIQHPLQTGLTMRTIETLGARKKLITTNQDINNYDICNGNVHVINRELPAIENDFIMTEYQKVETDILFKYSLLGWILAVFN